MHAGIKPEHITAVRDAHPGADFLIHPECGCSTSVMEYVAAGDVDADGVRMLSTSGMVAYANRLGSTHAGGTAIVATETGMLHPLRQAAPGVDFVAANEAAHCRYMKMITLPKLRKSLADDVHEVKVPDRDRRSCSGADRAHGLDQLRAWSSYKSILRSAEDLVLEEQHPAVHDCPDRRHRHPPALKLAGRVAVHGRRASHLERIP